MDTEIVRIYSGACKDIFTSNKGGSFCNQLYKPLKLPTNQYECCVTNTDFILKQTTLFGYKSADNVIKILFDDGVTDHIGIEEPKTLSLKEVVNSINKGIAATGIRFILNRFKVKIENTTENLAHVGFNEGLAKVFTNKIFTIKAKTFVNIDSNHSVFQPKRIHILTDFTKNQLTADRYLPIAKTIYVGKSEYHQENTQQNTFVTVIKSEINTIRVEIVDDKLQEIVEPESQSYIEFLFRPKIY